MDSNEIRNKLLAYQSEIVHYSQLQTFSRNPYEKNYYQNLIQSKTDNLSAELEDIFVRINALQNDENNGTPDGQEELPDNGQRVFTAEELSEFDGSNGKPAYVAVNGTVYDVSDKAAWAGGTHFAGLRAGNDLSGQFASCHRGMAAMLEQLPVVGSLAATEE